MIVRIAWVLLKRNYSEKTARFLQRDAPGEYEDCTANCVSIPMKIVIPGGSGQVGRILCSAFHAHGDEVVVLSRRPESAPWNVVRWDGERTGAWTQELEGADAVINLAGRSVNCRYSAENRRQIMDSRIKSTRAIGEALKQSSNPPGVWLQASTATIYAHRFDAANDEETGILGGGEPGLPDTWQFSIDVAKAWEQALDEAETPRTRKVAMRSAIIMSPQRGGPFDVLLGLVRRGLGSASGTGKQFVSWINDEDFIRAVDWLIQHEEMEGAVNLAAPNPLPNEEFMSALRQAWGIRWGIPASAWMLEMGAFFMRTETELVLKSRRVTPLRLLQSGFRFHYPDWPATAEKLVHRWRRINSKDEP